MVARISGQGITPLCAILLSPSRCIVSTNLWSPWLHFHPSIGLTLQQQLHGSKAWICRATAHLLSVPLHDVKLSLGWYWAWVGGCRVSGNLKDVHQNCSIWTEQNLSMCLAGGTWSTRMETPKRWNGRS